MTIRFLEKDRTLINQANKILGVDANNTLPSVDGSNLTNLVISNATNSRSLTFDGSYATVTTVNLGRNRFYGVSSSGPQFTITSALRNAYQNGDLIYVIIWDSNSWCSFINSDTAGGTKLFVNGVETTSWRTSPFHSIFKLRLTTHTDGKLYVHLTDDLNMLDDFEDLEFTKNASIGQVLKYNPTVGKWRPKYNYAPKVLTIDNNNIHNYATLYTGGTYYNPNLFTSLTFDMNATQSFYPDSSSQILWQDYIYDNDYDHFYIIFQSTSMTNWGQYADPNDGRYREGNGVTAPVSPERIKFYLPPIDNSMVGKKITFLWDLPYITIDSLAYMLIYPNSSLGTGTNWDVNREPDYIDGSYSQSMPPSYVYQGYGAPIGFAYAVIGAGPYTKNSISFIKPINYNCFTFLAVDGNDIPTNPGSNGSNNPQAFKRRWIPYFI